MQELLYLLLPAAAASGWYAADRYHSARTSGYHRRPASGDYPRGIRHWLSMRPEHSAETIAKVLDGDREPYTTHMALGALFRKEGEMEKAIGLHQRLLARDTLTADERGKVLFELGLDYHRAGLFDRAEEVFLGLVESPLQRSYALSQLLDIYQHEKEWRKAIPCLQGLRRLGKVKRRESVAQFYCELAQESLNAGRLDEAASFAGEARRDDGNCARASLLLAGIEIARGNHPAALSLLERMERRTPETVAEAARILSTHLDAWPDVAEVNACVRRISTGVQGIPELTTLQALLFARQQSSQEARQFLAREAERHPSFQTLHTLAALMQESAGDVSEWRVMEQGLRRFAALTPRYRCAQCGVAAEQLHWRCPACRHWETLHLAARECG
jgi:lipopolysaccharide biosynthesis regulator YciM